ncbi:hypothetical protein HYH03_018402 [Edaphochlamys debaryana]|uniref:N-acetyltransferase domain-containing protein n=1 Tax=Edaphochlamys debaryana TaxID=47281 RepID=A0A836BMZ6_9CHLO|nr:hypothetical protein HYH03_018402 [Edaphochlamys debaryana]|eukprot:KAG2482696.1 hypothetical protein HYH03_018402 [Edaphochlamys debaryana]
MLCSPTRPPVRGPPPTHRASAGVASDGALAGFTFRAGQEADGADIRALVLSEKLNPLGLEPSRFTVAEAIEAGADSAVAGAVQAVCLAPASASASADGGAWELRSLVVAPQHRGKGLGSALVRRQLAALPPSAACWLTTVERRTGFYERLGFKRRALTEAPGPMAFEVAAGLVVARVLAGQQLVLLSQERAK